MKAILASAIFLAVGISSVLACTAAYWSAGPDYIAPFNCPNVNTTNNLYKESYWSVKYPEQVGFTSVTSLGTGKCGIDVQCWPVFYSPQARDNLWKQIVDSQAVCGIPEHCCFWGTKTYPLPGGLAPGPGDCLIAGGGGCPPPDPDQCVQPPSCGFNAHWSFQCCQCVQNNSPILIDSLGNGFDLTDAINGVRFDLDCDGYAEFVAWTSPGSDDVFLALDRNGNGRIDTARSCSVT